MTTDGAKVIWMPKIDASKYVSDRVFDGKRPLSKTQVARLKQIANCQLKKSYPDVFSAVEDGLWNNLGAYKCDICKMYHLTSK